MLLVKKANERIYFGIDNKDIWSFYYHEKNYTDFANHAVDTVSVILKSIHFDEISRVIRYCRILKKFSKSILKHDIKIVIYTLNPSYKFDKIFRKICKKYGFRCWTGDYYSFVNGDKRYCAFRKDHFNQDQAGVVIKTEANRFCGYVMKYSESFFPEDGFSDLNDTSVEYYSDLNPIYKKNYTQFRQNAILRTARFNAANVFACYATEVAKELEKKYL